LAINQETEYAQRLEFTFRISGEREVLYDKLQYLRTSTSKNVREMLGEDLESISRLAPHGLRLTTFDSKDDGSYSTQIPLAILGISSHVNLGLLIGIVV
jgi:hypothetical protein